LSFPGMTLSPINNSTCFSVNIVIIGDRTSIINIWYFRILSLNYSGKFNLMDTSKVLHLPTL
jgi:hypothetical protein